MRSRIAVLVSAVFLLTALAVGAIIAAGSANFTGKNHTYTSNTMGTGANGQPVTDDYRVLALNNFGWKITDLIVSLLDPKGNQIGASSNNKINSVSVNGKSYSVSGTTTGARVNINPGIAPSSGASQPTNEIMVNLTTNNDNIKIRITPSIERPASVGEHYGYGGDCATGPGTFSSLVVPHLEDGYMFSLVNPEDSEDPLTRAHVQFAGEQVPEIDSVEIDGGEVTVEIDNSTRSVMLHGAPIPPGAEIQVWVKFTGIIEHPTAALIASMVD